MEIYINYSDKAVEVFREQLGLAILRYLRGIETGSARATLRAVGELCSRYTLRDALHGAGATLALVIYQYHDSPAYLVEARVAGERGGYTHRLGYGGPLEVNLFADHPVDPFGILADCHQRRRIEQLIV